MKKIKPKTIVKKKNLPNVMATLETFSRLFGDISLRLVAVEQILMEHLPELTPEALTLRIAKVQDTRDGLVPAETIDLRDRVRLRIQAQTKAGEGEVVYGPQSRLMIPTMGAGHVLAASLESQLFGMKVGEEKELDYFDVAQPEKGGIKARVFIDTIARQPSEGVPDEDYSSR